MKVLISLKLTDKNSRGWGEIWLGYLILYCLTNWTVASWTAAHHALTEYKCHICNIKWSFKICEIPKDNIQNLKKKSTAEVSKSNNRLHLKKKIIIKEISYFHPSIQNGFNTLLRSWWGVKNVHVHGGAHSASGLFFCKLMKDFKSYSLNRLQYGPGTQS